MLFSPTVTSNCSTGTARGTPHGFSRRIDRLTVISFVFICINKAAWSRKRQTCCQSTYAFRLPMGGTVVLADVTGGLRGLDDPPDARDGANGDDDARDDLHHGRYLLRTRQRWAARHSLKRNVRRTTSLRMILTTSGPFLLRTLWECVTSVARTGWFELPLPPNRWCFPSELPASSARARAILL